MLLGRERELVAIDQALAAARLGKSSRLLIRGEPGIGKTALLDHAVSQAGGMRVLAARGVEFEANVPFAGLHELLQPALKMLDRLPPIGRGRCPHRFPGHRAAAHEAHLDHRPAAPSARPPRPLCRVQPALRPRHDVRSEDRRQCRGDPDVAAPGSGMAVRASLTLPAAEGEKSPPDPETIDSMAETPSRSNTSTSIGLVSASAEQGDGRGILRTAVSPAGRVASLMLLS